MKDPKKCGDIIRAIRKATSLPVSAKIRLGVDNQHINYLDVIRELENAGVSFIAIHARTAKELYSGSPHFDMLQNLRKKMSVPLIISGNIFTLEDAIKAQEITGADFVMVARGAVGNPYLITQISEYFNSGVVLPSPSFAEQKKYCLELLRSLIEEKGEEKAVTVFRSMGPAFFFNLPNVKILKRRISSEITSYQSVVDIIEEFEKEHIS